MLHPKKSKRHIAALERCLFWEDSKVAFQHMTSGIADSHLLLFRSSSSSVASSSPSGVSMAEKLAKALQLVKEVVPESKPTAQQSHVLPACVTRRLSGMVQITWPDVYLSGMNVHINTILNTI